MTPGRKGASGGRASAGERRGGAGDPGSGLDLPAGSLGLETARVGPLPFWGWALVTAFVVWLLYVVTLAPTTSFWDTSEYIATAHVLGMPHPPGNPLFVMVGRVWDVLLGWTGLEVAVRINLLSATASAAASGFWFLTVVRVGAHFTSGRRQLLVIALVSVLVGATAYTVWSQSNVNEKVYTLSLFVVALVSYLAMLWEDVADTPRGDRLVLLVAFLLGLGATNHLMSVLPLGALAALVLWHRPRTLLRGRLLSAAIALAVVGFSVQLLFVPIRSAQNPVIDEADPGCERLVDVVPTGLQMIPLAGDLVPEDAVCEPLRAALAREQYGKPPLTERQAPLHAQLANYAQYFDWQWARSMSAPVRGAATLLFLLLGIVGLWRHWTGDRDSFVYFGILLFTVVPLLIFYLNFKYGYSIYPEIEDPQMHEVRERDYFYIVSFNVWGLYAGLGIATLWQRLAEWLRARGLPSRSTGESLLAASPLLLIALVPLLLNFSRADRTDDYAARDWAYNLLQSVEPYGILFTNGDNDTFPLWYLQEVEGIRRDVTVIVHSYLGTKWYARQLREMTEPCPDGVDPLDRPTVVVCQRPFDEENAVAPYRGMEVTPPSRSVLPLTDEELDRLPPYERVGPEEMTVPFSEQITGRLPANGVVTHGDLLVYLISRSSLGDRPVYFAATAPPIYGRWQLQPQLMRQALAHKLVDEFLESTADTVQLPPQFGVRWIDRSRTHSLLWDVFQIEYLLDWELWPEPSTRASIPTQYYLAYYALGEADRMREMPDRAAANFRRAERLIELSDLEEP